MEPAIIPGFSSVKADESRTLAPLGETLMHHKGTWQIELLQ